MKESLIKIKIKKILEKWSYWVYIPFDRVHKGIPDLFFLKYGTLQAMEIKIERKNQRFSVRHNQMKTLIEISKRGAISYIVVVSENTNDIRIVKSDKYKLYLIKIPFSKIDCIKDVVSSACKFL